ncbi:MAG: hypothetical protein GY765_09340 [bacterium]|nr:hypothetical protein [bacterium]
MNKTKTNDVRSVGSPYKIKSKKPAILLAVVCLIFFVGVSNQYATNCQAAEVWNDFAWTWSYADNVCNKNYNCLSYAIGITNSLTWPWGYSNGTSSQVSSYLKGKGYHRSGYNPRIISYGPSYNSISHFSKVTGATTCRAKCGREDLLNHGDWDPYTNIDYGSKQHVYYGTRYMQASIEGPTNMQYAGDYEWYVNVMYGTSPYSYEWHFSGADYDFVYMGSNDFVEYGGRFDNDVWIEVEVTDAAGYKTWESMHVSVGYSSGGGEGGGDEYGDRDAYMERNALESASDKDLIASNLEDIMADAEVKNIISGNPYHYIDSPHYRNIVAMGPKALLTIRKMLMHAKNNGFKEYILAIASEEIAGISLKKNSFAWENAKEYRREWDKHIRTLPANISTIAASNKSIAAKNKALLELGVPAIPYLMDEVAAGKKEFKKVLIALLSGKVADKGMKDDLESLTGKNSDNIKFLRNMVDAYNKKK